MQRMDIGFGVNPRGAALWSGYPSSHKFKPPADDTISTVRPGVLCVYRRSTILRLHTRYYLYHLLLHGPQNPTSAIEFFLTVGYNQIGNQ